MSMQGVPADSQVHLENADSALSEWTESAALRAHIWAATNLYDRYAQRAPEASELCLNDWCALWTGIGMGFVVTNEVLQPEAPMSFEAFMSSFFLLQILFVFLILANLS